MALFPLQKNLDLRLKMIKTKTLQTFTVRDVKILSEQLKEHLHCFEHLCKLDFFLAFNSLSTNIDTCPNFFFSKYKNLTALNQMMIQKWSINVQLLICQLKEINYLIKSIHTFISTHPSSLYSKKNMREIHLNIQNQRNKPKSSLAKVKLASARWDLNEQMVHKGAILALQWCWLICDSGDQVEFTLSVHVHACTVKENEH